MNVYNDIGLEEVSKIEPFKMNYTQNYSAAFLDEERKELIKSQAKRDLNNAINDL